MLSEMTVTSAPVSILNDTSCLFTLMWQVQAWPWSESMVFRYATSSMSSKSVVDGSSPTTATVLVKHWELKWPFFLHLWHPTRLAGHCCCEWGHLPHHVHFPVDCALVLAPTLPADIWACPFPLLRKASSGRGEDL